MFSSYNYAFFLRLYFFLKIIKCIAAIIAGLILQTFCEHWGGVMYAYNMIMIYAHSVIDKMQLNQMYKP